MSGGAWNFDVRGAGTFRVRRFFAALLFVLNWLYLLLKIVKIITRRSLNAPRLLLLHEHVKSSCAKTSLSAAGPSPVYQAPRRPYRRYWSCL
jgi:hypothetical protein